MWEWANQKATRQKKEKASLFDAYAAYLPQEPAKKHLDSAKIPSLSEMEETLQKQIKELGLKDIELRLLDFKPLSWEKNGRFFDEHIRTRKAFLKIIGYSHTDICLNAGLSTEDISFLKQSISPENFNVHIKIPFDFGGTPTPDNMCLIKTHPIHDHIHALQEYQLEKDFLKYHKKLYIPYFEGIVKYV